MQFSRHHCTPECGYSATPCRVLRGLAHVRLLGATHQQSCDHQLPVPPSLFALFLVLVVLIDNESTGPRLARDSKHGEQEQIGRVLIHKKSSFQPGSLLQPTALVSEADFQSRSRSCDSPGRETRCGQQRTGFLAMDRQLLSLSAEWETYESLCGSNVGYSTLEYNYERNRDDLVAMHSPPSTKLPVPPFLSSFFLVLVVLDGGSQVHRDRHAIRVLRGSKRR